MRTLANLWIDRSARPTLQDQLARQIRERIRSGDLAPGDSLPSTRDLATELKVSRNTAVYAYERLMSEGYLESASRACVSGRSKGSPDTCPFSADTAPSLTQAQNGLSYRSLNSGGWDFRTPFKQHSCHGPSAMQSNNNGGTLARTMHYML